MSFASPLVLAGLVLLPVLVWLLRAMPPQPVREVFGGMFFLERLSTSKQKPVRTPPIILIVRLLAFAALIIGLAGPRMGPEPEKISGPMTLVLGNGWDASQRWDERLDAARAEISRTDGEIRIVTSTDGVLSPPYSPRAAAEALKAISPKAATSDWLAVAGTLPDEGRTVIVPGGLAPMEEGVLNELGAFSAALPEGATLALGAPRISGDSIAVTLHRSIAAGSSEHTIRALSRDGRTVSMAEVAFAPGETEIEATFRLPLALRNDVVRLSLDGVRSAGTVALLGSSARRTLVGLVATGSETLRDGGFYVSRALSQSAEIIEAPLLELLSADPGMIVLDDVGTLRDTERAGLERFVSDGGLLLRFAGPDLLSSDSVEDDPLLPAPLLGGERALGGALTWAEPQRVASIDQESPLAGLALREEIAVRRQVLTEPGSGADVWASLADGTPLITAERRGDGLVVLIHVSAAPTWSDLPVSGLFAGLMQRLAALAETDLNFEPSAAGEPLPAARLLTGRGALIDPPADAPPLVPGEEAPAPGLYGEGASELAVNAYDGSRPLKPFEASTLPRGARVIPAADDPGIDLSAPLLAAALFLLILDGILTMGRLPFARPATAMLLAALVLSKSIGTAEAQIRPPLPRQAVEAALDLRFAYVKTGDPSVDRIAEAGLYGLTMEATQRSSLEPATPQGVDLDRDALSVYALLYWPVRAGQTPPSDAALQRLEEFMDGGGLLIVDTADGDAPGQSQVLRDVLGRLDAPPLEPLGPDNVLLFSFYRLDDLYGRNTGGQVWVETPGALDSRRDGVPSLIISGRDWASAWALDRTGAPLRPAGPGGEARREYAFRAGINMAMVAITGNYKADQTEVQSMLDKLGTDEDPAVEELRRDY